MLIQLGLNNSLANCHSRCHKIPGSVVVWNEERGKYELVSQSKRQVKTWGVVLAAGGLVYGLNGWTAFKSGDLAMSIVCGFLGFSAFVFGVSSLPMRESASDCAGFLNGLLTIANERTRDPTFQQTVRPIPLLNLFIRLLTIMQLVYPWLFCLVATAWPCSPLNMFSWIIGNWTTCTAASGSNISLLLARLVAGAATSVPHFILWKALFCQGAIDCVHIIVGSLSQKMLLQFLARSSSRSLNLSSADPAHFFKLYRNCQILNTSFNNYYSAVGLSVIGGLMVAEVSTSYLALKIITGGGGTSDLFLPIKLMLMVTCPTMYGLHVMAVGEAGRLNTISVSVLAKMRQRGDNDNGRQSKLIRRQLLRSATPLKIKIGESNFVEASTTLIILDFNLRRLLDLLLIEG